jgi:hypothetical protein
MLAAIEKVLQGQPLIVTCRAVTRNGLASRNGLEKKRQNFIDGLGNFGYLASVFLKSFQAPSRFYLLNARNLYLLERRGVSPSLE